MAGGRGERFWPHSRQKKPKHLLPIVGDKPMLSQTVDRLTPIVPLENIYVMTNREQRASILESCPEIKPSNVICEPVGRDTSAVVGLAMLIAEQQGDDAVFSMLPADSVIHDSQSFSSNLKQAFSIASANDVFVTLGITPHFPATGYGYIKQGEEFLSTGAYRVEKFVEKPNSETAQQYLAEGNFLWNAGIFVWSVKAIRTAFESLAPDIYAFLATMRQELKLGDPLDNVLEKHFHLIRKISIDYSVLEKSSNVVVIKAAFDWDDVGEWTALARHYPSDANGNVIKGISLLENSNRNIVVTDQNHLIALLGVDDLIVVHTPDATLICPKSQAQNIKQLVANMPKNLL